jgi:hypothetical protein
MNYSYTQQPQWTSDIILDEKKSSSKDYILYDSGCITFSKLQSYRVVKQIIITGDRDIEGDPYKYRVNISTPVML